MFYAKFIIIYLHPVNNHYKELSILFNLFRSFNKVSIKHQSYPKSIKIVLPNKKKKNVTALFMSVYIQYSSKINVNEYNRVFF